MDIEINKILKFWFGRVEETVVPSEELARIWFSDSPDIDHNIEAQFADQLNEAVSGHCKQWEDNPRGQLALIILLDQFSRHIYRSTAKAFAQDAYALSICIKGMRNQDDHALSLIERVFYYFPLLHAEHLRYQEDSIRAYQMLVELAFPETQVIYESFFKFANHHYSIVRRFGRFPQRNMILNRESSVEELKYLKETEY